jgi:hypothetical protein
MAKSVLSRGRWKKLDDAAFASAAAMYESGMSVALIAQSINVSRQSLWKSLVRRGTRMRSHKRYGKDNHFYRGGPKAESLAQSRLEKAVAKGVIVRPESCDSCGEIPPRMKDGRSAIQGHHPDYSKPLEVRWLCQRCHHKEHKDAFRR